MPDRVRCQHHLDQKRDYMRRYYAKNRKMILARQSGGEKQKDLLWRYGIRPEDYERLLDEQGGTCAACGEPETYQRNGKTVRLSVDHCHETGLVRGLLCGRCNRALGILRDSKRALAGLVVYLSKTEGVRL